MYEFYGLFFKENSLKNFENSEEFSIDTNETIIKWRKLIFVGIFTSFLVFAIIPYIISSYSAVQDKLWANFFIYSANYIVVAFIVFFRQIPFKIRVFSGLLVFYSLALIALITLGPIGSGKLYLLSLSIIATLLLGVRYGIFTTLINALTLLLVGFFAANGGLIWAAGNPSVIRVYVITSATFIFLNFTITISLAALVHALEKKIIASERIAYKLTIANDELLQNQGKRKKLEAQLIQAQKMESVGRLAGGVAHDYNNISSIIIGYSELALEKIEQSDPLHDDLMEISTAAKRSTNITRQLLAFARQQTIAPKVLDLNDTLESMLKMLRRLIGEDIDLAWLPGSEVWPVKMDPSQVDQILANLCVNARDAIADVGKVTIETENIYFDKAYCQDHAGFVPGEYVLLAVSDDGSGMAPETMNKIFEPFFTTKGLGKGTGLGLATVYGIVKQNAGFINVYSEPDKGTSIKVYLPRHIGQAAVEQGKDSIEIPLSLGSEVVLLVEDDVPILKLGKRILEDLGYVVLPANGPEEAIKLAEKHAGKIHLLITDVVMPGMNGRDLSKQLQEFYPKLKVLFMSGYTASIIAHRGVLEDGVSFISKPFSKKDVAVKARGVLAEPKGSTDT